MKLTFEEKQLLLSSIAYYTVKLESNDSRRSTLGSLAAKIERIKPTDGDEGSDIK